jgi:diguanylate cyclase (GGDEF)-like protein/PAS domain S-box-containing protein
MKNGKIIISILSAALLISVLYAASLYDFLLFHIIVETISVVIAGSIFVLAWNSRNWMENDYFLLIGISFLFVGFINLMHALTYKGMNIFRGYGADLPTQLWILAQYVQSISLLIAPIWLSKKLSSRKVFITYFLVCGALMGLIFANEFPVCYQDGIGLTPFKIYSEYIIITIFGAAGLLLFRKRINFEPSVVRSLLLFILVTIAAEFSFTNYFSVYDGANLLGHILRLIAYLFIYSALVRTGLQRPFDLVFRTLKQKEKALSDSEASLEMLFEINPFPVIITTQANSHIVKANQALLDLFELSYDELKGFSGLDFYENPQDRLSILSEMHDKGKVHNKALQLRTRSGRLIWCLVNLRPLIFEGEECLFVGLAEITEQKNIQEELQYISIHDALTGVYNRTFFEAEIERLGKSRQFPVSVIMLDVDDLKIINDTYGHAQGDKTLQIVVNQIKSMLRSEEVFCRIGGDEFAILLPNTDKKVTAQIIKRIENQFENLAHQNKEINVRVSLGQGTANNQDTLHDALMQADSNMYTEKMAQKQKQNNRKPKTMTTPVETQRGNLENI